MHNFHRYYSLNGFLLSKHGASNHRIVQSCYRQFCLDGRKSSNSGSIFCFSSLLIFSYFSNLFVLKIGSFDCTGFTWWFSTHFGRLESNFLLELYWSRWLTLNFVWNDENIIFSFFWLSINTNLFRFETVCISEMTVLQCQTKPYQARSRDWFSIFDVWAYYSGFHDCAWFASLEVFLSVAVLPLVPIPHF